MSLNQKSKFVLDNIGNCKKENINLNVLDYDLNLADM